MKNSSKCREAVEMIAGGLAELIGRVEEWMEDWQDVAPRNAVKRMERLLESLRRTQGDLAAK